MEIKMRNVISKICGAKMKINKILIGVLLFLILIITGCTQQTKYVCSDGSSVSDSSLCIKKEPVTTSKIYKDFTVRIHSGSNDGYGTGPYDYKPTSFSDTNNLFLKLSASSVPQHFSYWVTFIINNDIEEDIDCEVEELWDGSIHNKYLKNIYKSYSITTSYGEIKGFSFNAPDIELKPSNVRFVYECVGKESGKKVVGSYKLYLTYE